jgi:hypothetical protein
MKYFNHDLRIIVFASDFQILVLHFLGVHETFSAYGKGGAKYKTAEFCA